MCMCAKGRSKINAEEGEVPREIKRDRENCKRCDDGRNKRAMEEDFSSIHACVRGQNSVT